MVRVTSTWFGSQAHDTGNEHMVRVTSTQLASSRDQDCYSPKKHALAGEGCGHDHGYGKGWDCTEYASCMRSMGMTLVSALVPVAGWAWESVHGRHGYAMSMGMW